MKKCVDYVNVMFRLGNVINFTIKLKHLNFNQWLIINFDKSTYYVYKCVYIYNKMHR